MTFTVQVRITRAANGYMVTCSTSGNMPERKYVARTDTEMYKFVRSLIQDALEEAGVKLGSDAPSPGGGYIEDD